jgi:hypothetical protein
MQCVEENHRNYKEKVGRRNFDCVNPFKVQWSLQVPPRLKLKKIFHVLPTHCIYVFCMDLRTNNSFFSYTALTDRFLYPRRNVYTAPYGLYV